jgi:DNA-binding MarR family transcriptional regulator
MAKAAERIDEAGELAAVLGLLGEPGRCHNTALRKAVRRVSQIYDAALAPCGLRSTQRSILVHIARAGCPSIGALAQALVLDRSALTRNLKPLERDGLVASVPDEADRRSRRVRLTSAGLRRLRESASLWQDAQDRFEGEFGIEPARALRSMLDRVAALPLGDDDPPGG